MSIFSRLNDLEHAIKSQYTKNIRVISWVDELHNRIDALDSAIHKLKGNRMNTVKFIGNNRITFDHEDELIILSDINEEDDAIHIPMEDWHDIRLEIDKECGKYL